MCRIVEVTFIPSFEELVVLIEIEGCCTAKQQPSWTLFLSIASAKNAIGASHARWTERTWRNHRIPDVTKFTMVLQATSLLKLGRPGVTFSTIIVRFSFGRPFVETAHLGGCIVNRSTWMTVSWNGASGSVTVLWTTNCFVTFVLLSYRSTYIYIMESLTRLVDKVKMEIENRNREEESG